jgi:hypothetical protein
MIGTAPTGRRISARPLTPPPNCRQTCRSRSHHGCRTLHRERSPGTMTWAASKRRDRARRSYRASPGGITSTGHPALRSTTFPTPPAIAPCTTRLVTSRPGPRSSSVGDGKTGSLEGHRRIAAGREEPVRAQVVIAKAVPGVQAGRLNRDVHRAQRPVALPGRDDGIPLAERAAHLPHQMPHPEGHLRVQHVHHPLGLGRARRGAGTAAARWASAADGAVSVNATSAARVERRGCMIPPWGVATAIRAEGPEMSAAR